MVEGCSAPSSSRKVVDRGRWGLRGEGGSSLPSSGGGGGGGGGGVERGRWGLGDEVDILDGRWQW